MSGIKVRTNKAINEAAEKTSIPTPDSVKSAVAIGENTPFIIADAFNGKPTKILGLVMEIRKVNGKVPSNIYQDCRNLQFCTQPIPGCQIDDSSILTTPTLRQNLIIDQTIASNVGFFSFLSAQMNANTYFRVNVMDQMSAIVDFHDDSWKTGVLKWKDNNQDLLDDDNICYLLGISGFVQKYVITKKYVKYDGKVKGGAYGININGELATSREEFQLSILYGLQTVIIKRPLEVTNAILNTTPKSTFAIPVNGIFKPTKDEVNLLKTVTGSLVKLPE